MYDILNKLHDKTGHGFLVIKLFLNNCGRCLKKDMLKKRFVFKSKEV